MVIQNEKMKRSCVDLGDFVESLSADMWPAEEICQYEDINMEIKPMETRHYRAYPNNRRRNPSPVQVGVTWDEIKQHKKAIWLRTFGKKIGVQGGRQLVNNLMNILIKEGAEVMINRHFQEKLMEVQKLPHQAVDPQMESILQRHMPLHLS